MVAIAMHLALRWSLRGSEFFGSYSLAEWPLIVALVGGGLPLVVELIWKLLHREFGSDLLAGISIVTSIVLGEYLAGTLVVLMLSGGEAIEAYAAHRASSVLEAIARRMPTQAHRKSGEVLQDIPVDQVGVGDTLVVFPHEVCPVDGTVLEGHGTMDESFLTGEPYLMPKSSGSMVISGALNGEAALTIRADKLAIDSRYAQIMQVMEAAEQRRPRLRRLGDQLGAIYTPLAVAIALLAWALSGDELRFLAVLVVATPCPLLIAIPVAIIGSISLAARRGIIIRDPSVLERIETCRTAIFDKTGTLTYGQPTLSEIIPGEGISADEALSLIGSLERYSKHPLASAILSAARERNVLLDGVAEVHEFPGQGLTGIVSGRRVRVTSRSKLQERRKSRDPSPSSNAPASSKLVGLDDSPQPTFDLPPQVAGMECIAIIDETIPVTFRFRDQPRADGASFVKHLAPNHHFDRVMIVSGDRESEVRYLAELVGIHEVHFNQSPEQKLAIVRNETKQANTVFVGDGINDAPALATATVGIAFGQHTDITSEAAHAVILDSSLGKVDELLHIGQRLRHVALQSAVGGMLLSVAGMILASLGHLPPVAGAIAQEIIDLLAVLNALRAAKPPVTLTDFHETHP
jgi:heavy metal translocating P-type ATPase